MAGGKGTRLQPVIHTTPKLLALINKIPLLDYIINHLKKNGCTNIIICTGYLSEKIQNHISQRNYGIKIRLSKENSSLGTAGSLNLIKDFLEDEFFILYGDVFTTISLSKMLKFHRQKKADATLALHISDHPQDSTIVKIDKNKKIINLVEKPGETWGRYGNLTTTPLYILKKNVIEFILENKEIDFAKDVFPQMIKKNKKLFGYITKEYSKDIGTPERYQKVQKYIKSHQKDFLL